jgi:hypothetical protein
MIAALILAASICHEKDMLESFLKDRHELRLHSWGLSDEGNMMELWLGDEGHWAVVTTTPDKCSTVELPHNLKGRLWIAPSPNKAIPPADRMNKGEKS